jgi:HK97 family phage major capsid protein
MTREQYLAKRNELLANAEVLLNEGKVEEFNAVEQEVKDLDAKFENVAKAQANMNALKGNQLGGQNFMSNSQIGVPEDEDKFNTTEYRKAFMNNVLKGAELPKQFQNVDANTKTSDVGTVIPTTVMEKIIEKLEATGMILPLVNRTSFKGGLSIPTSSVKPVASWVVEGVGSDRQKKTTSEITFTYHKLRCAISVSLEVDTMALAVFESTFINNVVEAMVKAQEQAIISGTGTGQPKGILTETVVAGQNVDIAAADSPKYQTLVDAEAALPLAYETGAVWFMTKKTFMAFIGMVDADGQPIARVNYGINGRPERTLLGRSVVLNDYMSSFAVTVGADTVVAFLFNPRDYALNTNYQMTIKKYEDNETDDLVTKAIMLVDGKVTDKNSLVTVTKKTATV